MRVKGLIGEMAGAVGVAEETQCHTNTISSIIIFFSGPVRGGWCFGLGSDYEA